MCMCLTIFSRWPVRLCLVCIIENKKYILLFTILTDPRDQLSFPTFSLFSLDAVQLAEQLTEIAAVSCVVSVLHISHSA